MPLTTDSLVYTKLRPSKARPELVARPRLTAKLERQSGRKLTLISAPAGFGKTTLLVEWLKGRADGDHSVAWVSLDEGDNDPVRFLSYLVAALGRTVGEGFGEGILAALRSPEPPRRAPSSEVSTQSTHIVHGDDCSALHVGQHTRLRLHRLSDRDRTRPRGRQAPPGALSDSEGHRVAIVAAVAFPSLGRSKLP